MLTVKELMQPRYKALTNFDVRIDNRVLQTAKGDVAFIPDDYLKLCPPDSVKKLEWWECREPEDMPQFVEDKHRQPYHERKETYVVKIPFTNTERTKFRLGALILGTMLDFNAPIEDYMPVDSVAVKGVHTLYGGRGMGKTAYVKQFLQDHSDILRDGYAQHKAKEGTLRSCEAAQGQQQETAPFLARLKDANEKKCPILKAPACSVKPQVQVLNISTAVGELCSHILYQSNPLNAESNKQNIADSIGDIGILLDSLSQRLGLSLEQCIEIRFNRSSLKQGNHDVL